MDNGELNRLLGNLDLFILDQILKGRFNPEMKILDAGCGEGRNLNYFFHHNYQVYGIDKNPAAIRMVHFLLRSTFPGVSPDQFSVGAIESMPFRNEYFDVILCQAVLHFAQNQEHFTSMFEELHRCLRPKGILLISCAYQGAGVTGPEETPFSFFLDDPSIKQLEQNYTLRKLSPAKTVRFGQGPLIIELIMEKQ